MISHCVKPEIVTVYRGSSACLSRAGSVAFPQTDHKVPCPVTTKRHDAADDRSHQGGEASIASPQVRELRAAHPFVNRAYIRSSGEGTKAAGKGNAAGGPREGGLWPAGRSRLDGRNPTSRGNT